MCIRDRVKGIFKDKERKSLTEQIEQTEKKISEKLEKLPYVLKKDGYPDVQAVSYTHLDVYKRQAAG